MIYSRLEPENPETAGALTGFCECIQAVGTDAFRTRLADLMLNSFQIQEFLVFRRSLPGGAPAILFTESRDGHSAARARAYCAGFYREDPIYQVLNNDNPDGTYAIRVRMDEIRNPIFRNTCYRRPGLGEKLTLAAKSGDEIVAISLFGYEREGGFTQEQVNQLTHFGSMLLPILSLHYRLIGDTARPKRVSAAEMEECVAWAFPELTARETAVCARSILGVTAEGIALDLGIKQTSVLTYRRRAYARLNINSINQLSTILIQSSAARQLAAAS